MRAAWPRGHPVQSPTYRPAPPKVEGCRTYMELGVVLLTVGAYGLAVYQGLRERTALYVVALLAGQLSTLPSPLWQLLYRFSYQQDLTPLLAFAGHPLPRAIAL